MLKDLKNYSKKIIYNNKNFINIAPKIFSFEEINNFILSSNQDELPYIFYNNKNFSYFYWNEYKKYIIKRKINEQKIYSNIKNNFNIENVLELITIYSSLIIIGKFTLSLKIRRLFEKLIKRKKFIYKTKYIKIILRTINSLQSHKFDNKKKYFF